MVQVSLSFLALLTAIYILLSTLERVLSVQAYENQITPPRQPVIVNVPDMNPKYGLSLRPVQIDTERMFCKALLEFGDDLTEKTWLGGRWQSMGGIGRGDFAACKDRLTRLGALERVNPNAKNSPHRIADSRILAHRASHPSPAINSPAVTFGRFKSKSKYVK